ncbi:MAG: Abi family protein [Paludibacteraceae bacterium]|nr:Abi family protein [Paludibacteraceae bacterium]
MVQYIKRAITITEQIQSLKSKGLKFFDEKVAETYMLSVGYFRLDAYFHTFFDFSLNQFFPNTTFESIVYHYKFDCELRCILFAAIQDIEIAIRTRIVHYFSLANGPFWFAERKCFKDRRNFFNTLAAITNEISRSKEDFIIEHFGKYDEPNLPPAWKALETVTIGTLSTLYRDSVDTNSKKEVAKSFEIPNYTYLESWLESIRVLRNACAHHSRLWNKKFQAPIIPERLPLKWITNRPLRPEKIYSHLCYIAYIQQCLNVGHSLKIQIKDLLSRYPAVSTYRMGFPQNWQSEPLWN